MILLIDNYDSFVHNVARSLRELGEVVAVVRNDRITVEEARALHPAAVVLSPGPCTPAEAGISVPLVRAFRGEVPILGICLGHQAIAVAYGGSVIRSPDPAHGSVRWVEHSGDGILRGLPSPFPAGLYHSLSVDPALPSPLVAEGWAEGGELMVLRDREAPVWGVQFHPESILTPTGEAIFRNFRSLLPAGRPA